MFHVTRWTYYSRYSARADGTIYDWDTSGFHWNHSTIHFYRAVHSPTGYGWYYTRVKLSASNGHITRTYYWDWHQPAGFWWIIQSRKGGGF